MRPVAATGSTRYTKRDLVLGGHFLPKGTMVDVPFYAVGPPDCITMQVALPESFRGVSMSFTSMSTPVNGWSTWPAALRCTDCAEALLKAALGSSSEVLKGEFCLSRCITTPATGRILTPSFQ